MLGLRPLQELVHGVEDAFKRAPAPAVLPLDVLHRAAAALRRALEAAGGAEQEQAFAPLAPLRAELADALAAPAPSTVPVVDADAAERPDDASVPILSAESVDGAGGAGESLVDAEDSAPADAPATADVGAAEPSASTARAAESDGPTSTEAASDAGADGPISMEAAPAPSSIPPGVPSSSASAVSPAAGATAADAPASTTRTPSTGNAPAPERRSDAGAREESLRIPFARLDPLLSQVDDMARAVEGLRAWAAENAQALQAAGLRRGAAERLEELESSASAVRRGATSLRLVAVERVFSRFPPLATELARERGKRVRVELHGEGTELDKATSDALLDPLLHLVRNAVDHGVEPPEERRAAGKPETAIIRLSAAQDGDRVRIEVEDDGRGLDRAAIERRARQLGLVPEGEALDELEVDELLFRPGFSTRTEADEVSGRGVGLDVVREAVSRLRGQVRVEDGDEGGTRFVLLVPLTVALVPVLFFTAAGQTFAIPALDVEETLRAGTPGRTGPAETVAVHDEAVPLVRLDRVFGWEPAPDPRFVLVLRRGTRAAALGADRLLAQDAATVRALPSALGGPRGVSGAVVDARGRVVLLLDPGEMLEMNVDLYRGGTGGG
jgi:two-component system chemotaxis sensor kinase CheA